MTNRRWFRLSLKAALYLTLLVAAYFAGWSHQAEKHQREMQQAEAAHKEELKYLKAAHRSELEHREGTLTAQIDLYRNQYEKMKEMAFARFLEPVHAE